MSEPYSPLRYPGGKAKLSPFLIQVLAHNSIVEPHYVEPYAGGAGAALRLLFEEYVESITINDADYRIRCFWDAVTGYNEEFLDLLTKTEVSVAEWYEQRKIYEAGNVEDILKLGFATFFLNRTTRSGIIHNGGPIGGYEQNGKYKINARYNRDQLARRIYRIGAYADRIKVSGLDGLDCIKEVSHSQTADRTFIYLDPPYYVKGASLYMNRFTHVQHQQLADHLLSSSHTPWVLTYDNVGPIRALYNTLPQIQFTLGYSAYTYREGKEVLIHSNTLNVPQEAVQSLPTIHFNTSGVKHDL
ncbi:DNA adenine methylase [Dethiosulfatarculus sandiegensis]|uniref:site-specific DNA-methyltransferase (adenine-specific) n=1 Tax=Dethiosulfatarculus sandiegensis TaxID=1429043 RepID=A0A0D2JBL9_9BACT|nr:DNA adenine methylase [Dethiosulfatarculus sandiegensis]KIX15499.1 DNA methyltransferase [Dethiosulfatarculus sandiegensis]